MLIPISARLAGVIDGKLVTPNQLENPSIHLLIMCVFVLETELINALFLPAEDMVCVMSDDDQLVELSADDPRSVAAIETAESLRDQWYMNDVEHTINLLKAKNYHAIRT